MVRLRRSKKGTLALELAATSVFLLGFTLISLDIGLLLFGASVNDRACRDACRAAAQARNATDATKLANAVLARHRVQGMVTAPTLVSLTFNDFGGNPPADESPVVTVVTTCNSTLPFAPPQLLGGLLNNRLTYNQSYTFPIVRARL